MNKLYTKAFLCLLFLAMSTSCLLGQTDSVEIIKPILLDKEALSGIGLQKIELKKEPERAFFQRNLFSFAGSDDLHASSIIIHA